MREKILLCIVCLFFLVFGWNVSTKEQQLQHGTKILLALAPVDPRSLMQGDYMTLRFGLERDITAVISKSAEPATDLFSSQKRQAVVVLDRATGIAQFSRLYDGTSSLGEDEYLLVFRIKRLFDDSFSRQYSQSWRGRFRIDIASNTFFFQEGFGRYFLQAKYAELRVAPDGDAMVVHLLDRALRVISPEEEEQP